MPTAPSPRLLYIPHCNKTYMSGASTESSSPQSGKGLRTRRGLLERPPSSLEIDNDANPFSEPRAPKTYSPPSYNAKDLGRSIRLIDAKRRLATFCRKNKSRLLYWTAGLLALATLACLFLGRSAVAAFLYGQSDSPEPESLIDQLRAESGHGHMNEAVERLERLEPWTSRQRSYVRLKRFFTGKDMADDTTFNQPCVPVLPPELESGLIAIKGQKPSRGHHHVVVAMEEVLRLQTELLERINEELPAEDKGSPIVVAPKAWADADGLIHPSFNPCLLSVRSATGLIMHMVNPSINNAMHDILNPAKAPASGQSKVLLDWNGADVFAAGEFPPLPALLYDELRVSFHSPATNTHVALGLQRDVSYPLQMWIHILYADAEWRQMTTSA